MNIGGNLGVYTIFRPRSWNWGWLMAIDSHDNRSNCSKWWINMNDHEFSSICRLKPTFSWPSDSAFWGRWSARVFGLYVSLWTASALCRGSVLKRYIIYPSPYGRVSLHCKLGAQKSWNACSTKTWVLLGTWWFAPARLWLAAAGAKENSRRPSDAGRGGQAQYKNSLFIIWRFPNMVVPQSWASICFNTKWPNDLDDLG